VKDRVRRVLTPEQRDLLKKQIDAPIAQLILDLEERGLLNRTLIVIASEFSRDAMVEGRPDQKVKDQIDVPPG